MHTVKFEFKVGEVVRDDLTGKKAKIIGITYEDGKKSRYDRRIASGCIGYWIDNDWMNGGRHPWEISKFHVR